MGQTQSQFTLQSSPWGQANPLVLPSPYLVFLTLLQFLRRAALDKTPAQESPSRALFLGRPPLHCMIPKIRKPTCLKGLRGQCVRIRDRGRGIIQNTSALMARRAECTVLVVLGIRLNLIPKTTVVQFKAGGGGCQPGFEPGFHVHTLCDPGTVLVIEPSSPDCLRLNTRNTQQGA